MNKALLVAVVAIVLIGGISYFLSRSSHLKGIQATQNAGMQTSADTKGESQVTGAASTFTVTADNTDASMKTINVKKGNTISITFNVKPDNVYHGGLDFRSSVVNSGPIEPGTSKTITFTANKSFMFTPYWSGSNVIKPYTVAVRVH